MGNQKEDEDRKDRKKAVAILIFLMVCIIVVLVAVIITLMNRKPEIRERDDSVLERGFVNDSNLSDMEDALQKQADDGMFECMMSTYWTFPDAESKAPNSYVENVENNHRTFYFDLVDPETDEVYYSSPLVPVGSSIKGIKLDKGLPVGEHEMLVKYVMVDDDYQEVSSVGFMITVEVLK